MGSCNFRSRVGFCGIRMQQRLCNGDERWSYDLTDGKPQVDDDTGLVSYTDAQGNEMQINRDEVSQIIER